MKKEELTKIIIDNVSIFIDNIAYELEHSHDRYFEGFGFPMFGATSRDYHEQVYFEPYLESYTRKMINAILKEMLDQESADEIYWPEMEYHGIYTGYTNTECEKEFKFEFIDFDTKIGYRYAFFYDDEIDGLLKTENVEKIKLIIWESEDETPGFVYGDERAEVISLWNVFKELFYDSSEDENYEMYILFVDQIKNAVDQAKNMISLSTVPGFTPQYIYKNRAKVLAALQNEVKELKLFSVNSKEHKYIENDSKRLIQEHDLVRYFLDEKFDEVFVGKSNFAKSFLTSEYLYKYFKKNPMFDYTPIVSGYLKSIEQLLYSMCLNYRNANKIRYNLNTLNDYTEFIDNNSDMLRSNVQRRKKTIVNCLNSYRIESRNKLFHKHYLDKWDRVEQIRKNTIFLYVVLLGSVDLSKFPFDLKLIDDRYNRLFELLDKNEEMYYDLVFKDDKFLKMRKERCTAGITFNKYGQIENKMKFIKFAYDHNVTVEISKSHIPEEIWESNLPGKNRKRIF